MAGVGAGRDMVGSMRKRHGTAPFEFTDTATAPGISWYCVRDKVP